MGDRVRATQERRRSGAAGPHGRRPTRAEVLADALADEDDLLLIPVSAVCGTCILRYRRG